MYTSPERQVARQFLQVSIPSSIKMNEISCNFDTMECYEALFDCAHCIISKVRCESDFMYSIIDSSFVDAISTVDSIREFCSAVVELLQVINNHR